MTAQDIINEVRAIVQETDPNNTHRSDTLLLVDINACTLSLCNIIKTLPKEKDVTLTAADAVTVSSDMLAIDYASISNGATPAAHSPLETIDFPNFNREHPGWEDTADGQPTHLVRMTDTSWMMWPNPDATWTGKTVTLVGTYVPDAITSASSSPAVSVVLHPCYSHYCAWIFFQVLNNPERAAAEYAIYDGLRKLNTRTATSTRGSLLALRI
jgi:hypothetical protein